jgi:integrase/recombinase XerD
VRWATLPQEADPAYRARRLDIVRVFARPQAVLEPTGEIPPRRVLGPGFRRKTPHLFSARQIRQLLQRSGRLPGRLQPRTCRTLLGLLACPGLRIAEALALTVKDVDLARGVLTVRLSKFQPSRQVPLHPSARSALHRYARQRIGFFPQAQTFFVSERGRSLGYGAVHRVFVGLSQNMIPRNGRRRVRRHDLRHTFACRVLLKWQRSRRGAAGRGVILSRSLGHIHPSDTYWYLSAVPELLQQAAARVVPLPSPQP